MRSVIASSIILIFFLRCRKPNGDTMPDLTGLLDSISFVGSNTDSTTYNVTPAFYYKLEYDSQKRVKTIKTNYGWNGFYRIKRYYYNGTSEYPYLQVDSSRNLSGDPVATRMYYAYTSAYERIRDSLVTYSYKINDPSHLSVSQPTIMTYSYHPGYYVRTYLTNRDTFYLSNGEIVERKSRTANSSVFFSNTKINSFHNVNNPFNHSNLKQLGYNNGIDFGNFAFILHPLEFDISQNRKLPQNITGLDNAYYQYQQGERPVLNLYYYTNPSGLVNKVLLSKYYYKNGALFATEYYKLSLYYY